MSWGIGFSRNIVLNFQNILAVLVSSYKKNLKTFCQHFWNLKNYQNRKILIRYHKFRKFHGNWDNFLTL